MLVPAKLKRRHGGIVDAMEHLRIMTAFEISNIESDVAEGKIEPQGEHTDINIKYRNDALVLIQSTDVIGTHVFLSGVREELRQNDMLLMTPDTPHAGPGNDPESGEVSRVNAGEQAHAFPMLVHDKHRH